MSGKSAKDILYLLNERQLAQGRGKYSLSPAIDEIIPQSAAPISTAHDLMSTLHHGKPEDRIPNFKAEATAITYAERKDVIPQMRYLNDIVPGAAEVFVDELAKTNKNPNFEAMFHAINGLGRSELSLVEQRYEDVTHESLRTRLGQLRQNNYKQEVSDLVHLLDDGFDAAWLADQMRKEHGGNKLAVNWVPTPEQKRRLRYLLDNLDQDQVAAVCRIEDPRTHKPFKDEFELIRSRLVEEHRYPTKEPGLNPGAKRVKVAPKK